MKTFSTGSIRKHRKYNGDWEWQGFISTTENGKRKQLTKMTGIECTPPKASEKGKHGQPTGKGSKQALDIVMAWRDELVAAEATKVPGATEETVSDFVARYVKTLNIEPGTAQTYKYLLVHIGMLDMPIANLDAQRVEQWKLDMTEANIGDHMRNKTFNLLKYACNWGVATEAIAKNPCACVKAPPRPKREPNPLDPSELPRLVKLLDNLKENKPEFANMVLFALNTGMRRGELCALKWSDIDGYRDGSFIGCIHINRVIATKDGGTYIKDHPKNGNRRKVDINDSMRSILQARRNTLLKVSSDLKDCYVFAYQASPNCYPAPAYITKLWGMFASMNGIKGVEGKLMHFHDLRDTFATAALVNEIPVVTVAAILGHENANTTHKHYSHFIPSKNKEAMDFMSGLLNAS